MFNTEKIATEIAQEAGFCDAERIEVVAGRLFTITEVGGGGRKVRVRYDARADIWRMFVPSALGDDRSWQIALAVARWRLRDSETDAGDVNKLAAALMLPADATLRAINAVGHERAAAIVGAPVAAVYLREGALRYRPTALVVPKWSWSTKAGDPANVLPPARSPELLALATLPAIGVRRVRVSETETILRAS